MGRYTVTAFVVVGFLVPLAGAAEPSTRCGPDAATYHAAVDRGIRYLAVKGQAINGSYSEQLGIGPTALATLALLRHGRSADDPLVAQSLSYLEASVRADGGIYQAGTFFRNYETCLAMVCLQQANRKGRYEKALRCAEAFVKRLQWDENEGKERSDFSFGGAGYGKHKRPDVSNTSFLIDALHGCGCGADDPAIQKALIFVSRCQNLETEHNTTPFAAKVNDGGLYYTCAAGGQSKSAHLPDGGLRSYANMTYAGLKSMIYAGLGPDDPRVKAATEWIRKQYDLKTNPGLGGAGLYYYYHTFAKTMDALGEDYFEDSHGVRHDWRRELAEELARRQCPDGSWINETTRWYEGDPNLVTAYALLALSYCRPKVAGETP